MDQIRNAVAADTINKLLVAPLIQQIDDVIRFDQNRGLLQAKLKRMKLLLQDICNGFQNLQRTLRTPLESIHDCMESTCDAIGEAKCLIDRFQVQQRCLDYIFCKPRISRQIRKGNTRFDQLRQELQTVFSIFASAHQIGSSSEKPQAKELLQPLPERDIAGMDIKSAETWLQTWPTQGSDLRIIGVYVMDEIGKTTLLKSVYNSYEVSYVFDVVIWVTVSRDYKNRDLQCRIAKALNLDLFGISDLDTDTPKRMLSARLIKKKFLLILDDKSNPLDLQQELGIQFGDDKARNVVFSTRSRDRINRGKRVHKSGPLSMDEEWELFKRVSLKDGRVPKELNECAGETAGGCKGLPLAITVVKILVDRGLFENVNFEKQNMNIIVNKPVNVPKCKCT